MWNKVAWGPKSVMTILKTTDWKLRMFLSLFGACETNAYMAHNFARVRDGLPKLDHTEFRELLADALITRNRYIVEERDRARQEALARGMVPELPDEDPEKPDYKRLLRGHHGLEYDRESRPNCQVCE